MRGHSATNKAIRMPGKGEPGRAGRCALCGQAMRQAYYGTSMSADHRLCEHCAKAYWDPLDIEQFRVE